MSTRTEYKWSGNQAVPYTIDDPSNFEKFMDGAGKVLSVGNQALDMYDKWDTLGQSSQINEANINRANAAVTASNAASKASESLSALNTSKNDALNREQGIYNQPAGFVPTTLQEEQIVAGVNQSQQLFKNAQQEQRINEVQLSSEENRNKRTALELQDVESKMTAARLREKSAQSIIKEVYPNLMKGFSNGWSPSQGASFLSQNTGQTFIGNDENGTLSFSDVDGKTQVFDISTPALAQAALASPQAFTAAYAGGLIQGYNGLAPKEQIEVTSSLIEELDKRVENSNGGWENVYATAKDPNVGNNDPGKLSAIKLIQQKAGYVDSLKNIMAPRQQSWLNKQPSAPTTGSGGESTPEASAFLYGNGNNAEGQESSSGRNESLGVESQGEALNQSPKSSEKKPLKFREVGMASILSREPEATSGEALSLPSQGNNGIPDKKETTTAPSKPTVITLGDQRKAYKMVEQLEKEGTQFSTKLDDKTGQIIFYIYE